MATRLLFDSHVPRPVAPARRERGFDALALSEWRGGRYRSSVDEQVLRVAHEDGRMLVTYDVSTIPTLLEALAAAGLEHSGVLFVSARTIPQAAIGALVAALERFLAQRGEDDLRGQSLFLER